MNCNMKGTKNANCLKYGKTRKIQLELKLQIIQNKTKRKEK